MPLRITNVSLYLHDSRTLYELDRTGNRLKKLFSCTGDTLLYSVSMDEKGDFWIGSNTGLGQYSIRTRQYHPLITSLFGEASSVICDHRGKVWIGADHMLFAGCCNPGSSFFSVNRTGSFRMNILPSPGSSQGRVKSIWGGVNGLLCIDNRFPATSSNYPEVVLTDVRVNGEPATNRTAGNPRQTHPTTRQPGNHPARDVSRRRHLPKKKIPLPDRRTQ